MPRNPEVYQRRRGNKATDPVTRNLIDRMNALSISRSVVAERSGVPRSTIDKWAMGTNAARACSAEWVDEALRQIEATEKGDPS